MSSRQILSFFSIVTLANVLHSSQIDLWLVRIFGRSNFVDKSSMAAKKSTSSSFTLAKANSSSRGDHLTRSNLSLPVRSLCFLHADLTRRAKLSCLCRFARSRSRSRSRIYSCCRRDAYTSIVRYCFTFNWSSRSLIDGELFSAANSRNNANRSKLDS